MGTIYINKHYSGLGCDVKVRRVCDSAYIKIYKDLKKKYDKLTNDYDKLKEENEALKEILVLKGGEKNGS